METVKVLHLLPPGFGGIDTYVFNHYRYMDRIKFQFDFLSRNKDLEHAEQYSQFKYNVHLLPSTATEGKAIFIQYVQGVLSEGYDVLHLHTPFWTGFLIEELAKEAGIKKVIVHAHGASIEGSSDTERFERLKRHNELKMQFKPELATDFWACSQSAANWLFGEQIPREKIRIMKNAIDSEHCQFDQRKRELIRAELNLSDNFVLGTVGRLVYIKNQAFLIDLLYEFQKKRPKAKLIIIGDGELRGELEKQICDKEMKEDVLLLGWQNNVEYYYQAMDLFLLPSRCEGSPMALVEAVASGLQCIAADTISSEIEELPNVQRVPLDISSWLTAIDSAADKLIDRQRGVEAVRSAGYDVRRQAKVLERLYGAESCGRIECHEENKYCSPSL